MLGQYNCANAFAKRKAVDRTQDLTLHTGRRHRQAAVERQCLPSQRLVQEQIRKLQEGGGQGRDPTGV